MNKLFKIIFSLLLFLCTTQLSHAQDILKGKDLSQLKVDQLTDADIAKLKTQLASNGITIEQAEQAALAKGMSPVEFAKLKARLTASTNANSSTGKLKVKEQNQEGRTNANPMELDSARYQQKPRTLIDSLIFGSELYSSVAPSFEPNLQLATPVNYVLGPSDQIQVSIYGVQEYNDQLTISPEGSVSIPNVGQVKLAGLTIEAATQKLKTVMGNSVYSYLKRGESKIAVSLSKIRSIRVTIIGANRPGNFNISSLSTVFNALFIAGGPTAFGSFRGIELIRNNKVINTIDLYRFLLHGDQSDNVGLKDNDVIRIPPYKTRVELQGQVKRPGIFEVLPGEGFADVLQFASGFTDTAYKASVKVYQRNDKERKLLDLTANAFKEYVPQTGDLFVVSKILNRYQNRVTISGAVFRPDVYELSPDLKVADLIRKADGLKEDAYTARGQIVRLEEDLTRSIASFDIKKALANDKDNNLFLRREDEVLISSVLDLRDTFKVSIQGEIRFPGQYNYVRNLTLKDLILQAGSFTDAAYKNIEIARLIKRDSIALTDYRASSIINTEVSGDLSSASADITLEPFDVVTIRRKAGYTLPESVTVSGQVQYPGLYALRSSNERISDLINRAGGYSPNAYPAGAYLKRYKTELEKQQSDAVVKKLQKTVKDTLNNSINGLQMEIKREYDQIPLDLEQIVKHPNSVEDLILKSKDELIIPKFDGEVRISGSVLSVTQVPFTLKTSLKDYLDQAGGFSADAWRRKTYIVYANGKAATTKHFLFFKFYPKVLPGSEVVVPKKAEKKGTNAGEIIGISSALASLAGVVIAIIRL